MHSGVCFFEAHFIFLHKLKCEKIITGGAFLTRRIKDNSVDRCELLDEIVTILDDYFLCEFRRIGDTQYLHFEDGDVYALNLIKCNNLNTEKDKGKT